MAKPYVPTNEVQGALTSDFVHGTDNHLHLVSAADFDAGGSYIRVQTTDGAHWALYEYTAVSTNDLTGLTPCTLGVVETDAAYTFPAGAYVYRVCMGEDLNDLVSKTATAPAAGSISFPGIENGETVLTTKTIAASLTELGYCDGVTSAIQTQLDDKLKKDGSVALTEDWDFGDGRYIAGDKVRARDGAGLLLEDDGGNGIAIADGGIITMAKQSGAKAYPGTTYAIPASTVCGVLLDSEVFDVQGEFDVTAWTGTTTSATTNKLVDSGASFPASIVGAIVRNTTDGTQAKVKARDDATTLSLCTMGGVDVDIMANGENYRIVMACYTATVAGLYLCIGQVKYQAIADGKTIDCIICQNDNIIADVALMVGAEGNPYVQAVTVASLAIGDKVHLAAYHEDATAKNVLTGAGNTWLVVAKIA